MTGIGIFNSTVFNSAVFNDGIGLSVAAPTVPIAAPVDFVLLSGGMFHPVYGKPKEPETVDEGEFAEMAQIVSLWKAI